MKNYYSHEQLTKAMNSLLIGIGDIKERLYDVFIYNLSVLYSHKETYFNNNKKQIDLYDLIIEKIYKEKDNVVLEEGGMARPMIELLTEDEVVGIVKDIEKLYLLVVKG